MSHANIAVTGPRDILYTATLNTGTGLRNTTDTSVINNDNILLVYCFTVYCFF